VTRNLPAHGTLTRAKHHGCDCRPCVDAALAYERRRIRRIGYGTWRPYVDADPVRVHVQALRAVGMSLPAIATAAGVKPLVLQRLLYNSPTRPRTTRIRPANAEAILSVHANLDGITRGARVPALGTRRRLQALQRDGWSMRRLGAEFGLHTDTLYRALDPKAKRVQAVTARRVQVVFDRLAGTPGGSPWARNRAARAGWAPALAWDEDTIDDPRARPRGVARPRRAVS
jgi:hypothetical protein